MGDFSKEELDSYIKNNSTLEEIVSLLDQAKSFPSVTSGYSEDSFGEYFPFKNNVQLNISKQSPQFPATLTHELSHALDSLMGKNYYDIIHRKLAGTLPSKEEEQFLDGYNKLDPSKTNFSRPMNTLQEKYRYSYPEMRSWAVERHAYPELPALMPAKDHMDASLATEAAILRELYLRTLKSKK